MVGENIDFNIDLTQWDDLAEDKRKELKDIETSILEGVGPAFKVIEANIKDEQVRERFVQ